MQQQRAMKRFYWFVAVFLWALSPSVLAQHRLRIEITGKPAQHASDSLFLVGSFNGWNPGLPQYAFHANSEGKQSIELAEMPTGIYEFKITRGRWDKAECAADGSALLNRIFRFRSDTTIRVTIAGWTDDFPQRPPVTSRSKNVMEADSAFYMPQLNRSRRIWLYLPESYATSSRRYPVLYMHDGQNLFDVMKASFGEWGVDEWMDSLSQRLQCIIVGIEHGGQHRLTEYNPFPSRFGKGEGDAYADFVVQTLKPWLDAHYRTRPQKATTWIAGSSMGGLISLYISGKYPDVFGGVGVFSPAFWIAPQLNQWLATAQQPLPPVYFVCGELESDKMVSDLMTIAGITGQKNKGRVVTRIVPTGRHHESFWRAEMPAFYKWLQKIK
jgi:predicted alpha/beta superfamily hydrolase